MLLESKVALITGGTRGIGASTAIALATRGVDVALVGRTMDEDTAELKAQIEALGRRCVLLAHDMADAEEATACVQETVDSLGRLDVLIHSAGGAASGNILEVSPDTWHHAFDVHVHAAFYLCRAAIPHLRQHGEGAIVLVSSVAGIRGVPNAIAYGVVKGAILQFTRALARDLANDNIRVNCVTPGVIRTRFHQNMSPAQYKNNIENRIPLHREGRPEDVAEVIAMLVANEFMTGESVVVDGGMTMRIV